jgi:hypothetical protein
MFHLVLSFGSPAAGDDQYLTVGEAGDDPMLGFSPEPAGP